MADGGHAEGIDEAVGLCSACVHAATQSNTRGSVFWRCQAADRDERLLRYPPLPVRRCPAFERRSATRYLSTRRAKRRCSGVQRSGSGRPTTEKKPSRKL